MTVYGAPSQLTPFVGRDDELEKIAGLLADPTCRLLTLLGPGGTGKTRLAVEAARRSGDDFPGGVYVAGLQSITSPDLLVPAIAGALDFSFFSGGEPKQQLLDFLREKRLLLVLDNFEHLLDGAALVSDILADAPGVKVLATSRERLNLVEEWVLEVTGLAFASAVQLFTQTARRAQVNFDLKPDQEAVARICRAVDGMPLAIELSANWVRTLPCAAIADEIERGLDLLQTTARNVPERHRNMRAVLDHSWQLLSEAEQTTFMQMSVFRGSFTREAAAAVAGASVLTLASLVDKSMLRVEATGRYSLHELVRQYGAEHLALSGGHDRAGTRHAQFYTEILGHLLVDLQGRRQLAALDEIEADFDNIRAGWVWAAEAGDADRLSRCADSLYLFCEARSRFQEGAALFRLAEESLAPSAAVEKLAARRLRLRVLSFLPVGDDFVAECAANLATAQQIGDRFETAFRLATLGEIEILKANYISAQTYFQQALGHYRESSSLFFAARTLQRIAMSLVSLGDLEGFARYAQAGLDGSQALGDLIGMANCVYNLGTATGMKEDFGGQDTHYEEALALRRRIGDRASLAVNLGGLGIKAFQQGNAPEVGKWASEALEIAEDIHHDDGKGLALTVLGLAAGLREDYPLCRQLCQQARSLSMNPLRIGFVECGLLMAACGQGDVEGAREHSRALLRFGSLTGFKWLQRWGLPGYSFVFAAEGQPERALELIALASNGSDINPKWFDSWPLFTRLRARLEAGMSAEQTVAAWTHGFNADWSAVVANLLAETDPATMTAAVAPSAQPLDDPLSERELEVLRLIAAGLSNAEIADQLVVGGSTVKKHINHIFSKLDAHNRVQAIHRAEQLRLL